jgi:hypothetical protein
MHDFSLLRQRVHNSHASNLIQVEKICYFYRGCPGISSEFKGVELKSA